MANVEHSALTGSNLHEPKGASTATVSTVYVADGVGSGAWSTLGVASLASAAKAFQGALFHVQDSVSSGTTGQTLTTSTWNTHTLQTTATNEISGASLASNVISLPAGTYYAEIDTVWDNTSHFNVTSKTRLRDTTSGTTLLNSTPAFFIYSGSITAGGNHAMTMKGRFTLAGTKNIELQQWTNVSSSTTGKPSSSGEVEIYANVMIWKIA